MMDDDDQHARGLRAYGQGTPGCELRYTVYAFVQFIVLLFCLRLQQYTTQGKREENKKFQIALLS